MDRQSPPDAGARPKLREDEAKIVYGTARPDRCLIHFKEEAGNEISACLFQVLTEAGIPNHFIARVNPREMLVQGTAPIPLAVLVRNAAEEPWARRLGLTPGSTLPRPVVELYYREDESQEVLVNHHHVQVLGLAGPDEVERLEQVALAVNDVLGSFLKERGLDLIHLRLEFGRTEDGALLLAGELSPRTLRLALAEQQAQPGWQEVYDRVAAHREPWQAVGLTREEYDDLVQGLGRAPNQLELEMVGAMWSEHCSYKSTRIHLARLPREGPQVLLGPGENAGVVDLGGPVAVALRCESHNHPSSLDPHRGAATGAGGIVRDILAVGSRPALLAGALRVGPLEEGNNQDILLGAAEGMADYAAGTGIATFTASVFSGEGYRPAPLVNVLAAGFVDRDRVFRGRAEGVGNPIYLVGARTGPDGVRAASASSRGLDDEVIPPTTVPAANPQLKRRLVEACLAMMEADLLVGVNDLGAAGITSAASETAGRAGQGVDLDLDLVPCREPRLSPHEIMLSETQERMLLIVKAGKESQVEQILTQWNVPGACIGRVADHGLVRVTMGDVELAALPATILTEGAPAYRRPVAEPADLARRWEPAPAGGEAAAGAGSTDYDEALVDLLAGPNLTEAHWLGGKHDDNTLLATGAAAVPVPGTGQHLVVALAGNGRLTWLDPRRGAAAAVAEAGRRVACTGAKPLGLTNCLNLGSPEDPAIMWEFTEIIEGMGAAARSLDVPVTGGNVSLYNERGGQGVYPTPVVGVVGVLPPGRPVLGPGWLAAGHAVLVLGPLAGDLAGSEYLAVRYGRVQGRPPQVDTDLEARLWALLQQLHSDGLLASAAGIDLGGLAAALARACRTAAGGPLGVQVDLSPDQWDGDAEALLFGEGPSRVLVSTPPAAADQVLAAARSAGVPAAVLGAAGGGRLAVTVAGRSLLSTPVDHLPEPGRGVKPPWAPRQ